MKNFLTLAVAGLTATWMALSATPANANLVIQYQINGGPLQTMTDLDNRPHAAFGTITSGNLSITLTGTSDSPGASDLASLQGSALQIANAGGSIFTVKILIGDTGFTQPTAPPPINLFSQIGGSTITGATASSLSFRSCINTGNVLNSCPGTASTAFLSRNLTTSNSAWSDSNIGVLTALSGPYSITEEFDFTVGARANFNYAASTDLIPVPEPTSLFLLGASLIGLGVIARRRRVV